MTPAQRGLDVTALALMQESASAADLADRFAALGLVIAKTRAAELLRRLAALGLARVVAGTGSEARFAATTLGIRHAATEGGAGVEKELRELERLRGEMLAAVAHELRTPLTAIRTSVGLLLDESVSPDEATTKRLLKAITQSSEQMNRLVADVLDVARFRSGAIRLQLRQLDAVDLAEEAVSSTEPLFRAKQQPVMLAAEARPMPVYGDHRRLLQVLTNLLSNAHAFSPEEAPVRVRVDRASGDVTWTVVDHGVGIPDEDRPRLFERFFIGASRSGGGAGAGLGLPISLAIAEAHGGTIEVDSQVGQGSTFRLRVPASGPAEREP